MTRETKICPYCKVVFKVTRGGFANHFSSCERRHRSADDPGGEPPMVRKCNKCSKVMDARGWGRHNACCGAKANGHAVAVTVIRPTRDLAVELLKTIPGVAETPQFRAAIELLARS